MKTKIFTFAFFTALFLFSCGEKTIINESLDDNIIKLSTNNILIFNSKEDVLLAIQQLENNQICDILQKNLNFKSLEKSLKEEKIKLSNNSRALIPELTVKEELDTLVPNPAFRELLNEDRQIMVQDTIYEITPNGTYVYLSSQEEEFDQLMSESSSITEVKVSEDLYEIADGIYRYDTFKERTLISEDVILDTDIISLNNTNNGSTEPNFALFPSFPADHYTIVGKFMQSIFGSSKTYSVEFTTGNTKRVKGKFYFYNYGLYAESGVIGWTEFKNWIGWSNFVPDELRIGWGKVLLETDLGYKLSIPKSTTPVFSNPYSISLSNGSSAKAVNLFVYDIPYEYVQKAAYYGIKELQNLLKTFQNPPSTIPTVLNIVSPSKVYTIIFNENVKSNTESKLNHIFSSQMKIMVSVNLLDMPSNTLEWANALKGTLNMPYPKIKSGVIYVCAKYGAEWKGMSIYKK